MRRKSAKKRFQTAFAVESAVGQIKHRYNDDMPRVHMCWFRPSEARRIYGCPIGGNGGIGLNRTV